MKARMPSLSGDSLLQSIRDHFKLIKDHRDPSRIRIALSDFLMSGFSIFCLKFPSLLQFEEQMREGNFASHLAPIFNLIEVPSDTHMRSVLDEIDPESLTPVFKKLFNKVQESKRLENFQFFDGSYLISIDGTQCFSSRDICCSSCMSKKSSDKDGLLYYHQMLAGCIVHPEQECVIPLCPEPMRRQDGNDKNDCERAAMRRFLERLRADHPRLQVIIVADALHATGPLIRDLRLFDANFILGVKPGSHIKLFEGIEKWESRGNVSYFTVEEVIGDKIKKKRVHHFRYANKILYNFSNLNTSVNFLEYWETTSWLDPKGRAQEEKVHFSWVTDFEINNENIMQLMRGGRARWKIENETFNTLKNQGYEFEHNFGHGKKNLSTVFGYLMFLSFLFDQISQIGCKVFQKVLKHKKRKKYLRDAIRGWFMNSYHLPFVFQSWTEFLESIGPPKPTTSP
jgi:hypothetical protein